jgi:predicted aconitase
MLLKDDEKGMLNGDEGAAVQKAMELLVRYGDALGAEKFVDTRNVGGYMIADLNSFKRFGSLDAVFSEWCLDSDSPVKLPKVKVPSCQFETSMDPDHFALIGRTQEERDLYMENIRYLAAMGVQVICTCAPYLVGNVPVKGEHCVWMESSAVAYINGVLGARTNCEGRESATCAMLTGKIPYWGYHVPAHRLGTHLIEVEGDIRTMMDWGLLGYFAGKIVQDKVPVIYVQNPRANRDMLKHFGAAAASSGGTEMFHIAGLTAEASTVEEAFGDRPPHEIIRFGMDEKLYAYELLNSIGKCSDVDFVMLGCPHYSMDQLWDLCRMLEGKRVKDGVAFWVFVPQALKDVAERNGFRRIIDDSGAILMRDTCPAIGRFTPQGARVMATDSAKQAHYLPNLTGIEAWFGSTEDCVRAALTGRWEGSLE